MNRKAKRATAKGETSRKPARGRPGQKRRLQEGARGRRAGSAERGAPNKSARPKSGGSTRRGEGKGYVGPLATVLAVLLVFVGVFVFRGGSSSTGPAPAAASAASASTNASRSASGAAPTAAETPRLLRRSWEGLPERGVSVVKSVRAPVPAAPWEKSAHADYRGVCLLDQPSRAGKVVEDLSELYAAEEEDVEVEDVDQLDDRVSFGRRTSRLRRPLSVSSGQQLADGRR